MENFNWQETAARIAESPCMEIEKWLPEAGDLLAKVPRHLQIGLAQYVVLGIPTGSFLTSFLSNDLYGALDRADSQSRASFKEIRAFLHWGTDDRCFGSPKSVEFWIEIGGQAGIRGLKKEENDNVA